MITPADSQIFENCIPRCYTVFAFKSFYVRNRCRWISHYLKTTKMSWPHNVTTVPRQNTKASMYIEYNSLIKELEQYMPQFKVSIKDLQEPSQSFVTDFYTDVFSEFFCDVNNLTEIQVTQNLTYHEMYGETVPILNMCTALRYMYSKLGIDDFGLNDICDPSPKRTYRLLQTMINFIKYSDEKINEVDSEMKAIRNMKEKTHKLKKEKDILVNTINKKSLDSKQRESEIQTVTDDVKINKSECQEIQKHKEEILNELEKVKQEQFEVDKTYLKLSELKENIMRDITDLRSQIVEAPDLLKADLERFKRMQNEITEKKNGMMAQVGTKKQMVITLEQELVAQEKRLRLLTEVIEKNDKLSKLIHEIDIMIQKKIEIDECSEDLKAKIEIMERERADINQKINVCSKEMERDQNSFKVKYDALLIERDNMVKERSHHYETLKSLEIEINKYNLRKEEIKTDVASIIDNFEAAKYILNKKQNDICADLIKKRSQDLQLLENDA